ncbi:glycosyltransferase 1 domain-containing protein 1 isoform X6 [Ictalurus furcatus]|uniref:glycosyltransferase 1 domain-containing protein 1 isoform X6 n=1 Tax=Ictalurus furcatus TaxID=66913 RepID=UPI0023504B52|nr:glycosyltransferase 1 domain-containing protein 1 isoform X6 [Ictalurus furcatus]
MRILFLACLSPKTGNCTTAERIRDHIESAGHVCVLRDTREFSSASEITLLMSQHQEPFDAALAIHLFKGGRLLLDVGVPFGVVFGGTDINEDVKDEHKRSVMEEVLHRARFAVAFTEEMKQKAKTYLDCDIAEVHVQAQGIETRPSSDFSWTDFLHTSGVRLDRVDDLHVFLLVCGLRKVKDPLYLLKAFSDLVSNRMAYPEPSGDPHHHRPKACQHKANWTYQGESDSSRNWVLNSHSRAFDEVELLNEDHPGPTTSWDRSLNQHRKSANSEPDMMRNDGPVDQQI